MNSIEYRTDCIYRSGGQCKPPDNIILEDVHCENCRHYLTHLDQTTADIAIQEIIQGFSVDAEGKKINHPKCLSERFTNVELFLSTILFFNEDFISQCIAQSQYWNRIIHTHVANLIGGMYGSSGQWISQTIFGCPAKDLTIVQLFLLSLTLRYISYQNQYEMKQLCKCCLEEENKEIFLRNRQKHCHKNNNHFVGDGQNRITRFYFFRDQDKNCYISEKDFSVISLVEWFTEDFVNIIEAKDRVKNNLKKQQGK